MTTGERLCDESSANQCRASRPSLWPRSIQSIAPAYPARSPRCQLTVSSPTKSTFSQRIPMPLIETPRTVIRLMTAADADFIRELLNEPSFLRFIGDRQVRTTDDAGQFIDRRYQQSYRDHGYGLYVVASRESGESMGICGFVRRDSLPAVDMGFAFLPRFEGKGFAFESAAATLQYGRDSLGLTRVLAIAQADNARSLALLDRLGFAFDRLITMPGEAQPVSMYASEPPLASATVAA